MQVLEYLLSALQSAVQQSLSVDFSWLADRTSLLLLDLNDQNPPLAYLPDADPWVKCIAIFMSGSFVGGRCLSAVAHAWPILFSRLQALWAHVDPQ